MIDVEKKTKIMACIVKSKKKNVALYSE